MRLGLRQHRTWMWQHLRLHLLCLLHLPLLFPGEKNTQNIPLTSYINKNIHLCVFLILKPITSFWNKTAIFVGCCIINQWSYMKYIFRHIFLEYIYSSNIPPFLMLLHSVQRVDLLLMAKKVSYCVVSVVFHWAKLVLYPDAESVCGRHHGQLWVPDQRLLYPGATSPGRVCKDMGRVRSCCLVSGTHTRSYTHAVEVMQIQMQKYTRQAAKTRWHKHTVLICNVKLS